MKHPLNLLKSSSHLSVLALIILQCACGGGGGSDSSGNTNKAVNGSATLRWDAPVDRANGDPLVLSEITGYAIYYGESEGSYPNALDINDMTATSITITDLPSGTYYFVVTTRDTQGGESSFSDMVSTVID